MLYNWVNCISWIIESGHGLYKMMRKKSDQGDYVTYQKHKHKVSHHSITLNPFAKMITKVL